MIFVIFDWEGAFLGTLYLNPYMPAIFDERRVFKRHLIVKFVTSHLSNEKKPGFFCLKRILLHSYV